MALAVHLFQLAFFFALSRFVPQSTLFRASLLHADRLPAHAARALYVYAYAYSPCMRARLVPILLPLPAAIAPHTRLSRPSTAQQGNVALVQMNDEASTSDDEALSAEAKKAKMVDVNLDDAKSVTSNEEPFVPSHGLSSDGACKLCVARLSAAHTICCEGAFLFRVKVVSDAFPRLTLGFSTFFHVHCSRAHALSPCSLHPNRG